MTEAKKALWDLKDKLGKLEQEIDGVANDKGNYFTPKVYSQLNDVKALLLKAESTLYSAIIGRV